jgi:hypothetical protein
VSWLVEMPYAFCSIGELEDILHFISRANIGSVIGEKIRDPEMKRWIFNSFIWNQATEDFKKTYPAFVKKLEEPLSSRLERGSLLF